MIGCEAADLHPPKVQGSARTFRHVGGFYAPGRDVEPIHLHDVQAQQGPSAGQDGVEGHLAELLSGRQDRGPRSQRDRQVDPAADHGRRRHRVPGRGPARARRLGRPARAGAAPGRVQGRAGQRRGRRARAARAARPLQRAVDELLRRDRGRVRAPPGPDRRRRRLGARPDARPGDGRPALPARRRRRERVEGGERRRVALARLLLPSPTCCCSTSPPTTSTPSPSPGWSAIWPTTRARSSPSPTIATSSTTSRAGFSSWTAATGCRSRATTRRGSSRRRSGSPRRRRPSRPASARSSRSSSGCARTRRAGARRPRRA